MPVEDHAVHPSTQKGEAFRYGCHNRKPFLESYYAPQRRAGANGYEPTFYFERVRIPFRMSRDCVHARTGAANTDAQCQGCQYIAKAAK